jgi:DNA-binding XRE family transcriptional regulator
MSYVYLLPLSDQSAFKIGKAAAPQRRITQLTHFYSVDIGNVVIISCWNDDLAFKLESSLHTIFQRYSCSLEGDGGTEFFDYSAYPLARQICESIGKVKGYSLIQFVVDATVKTPANAEVVLSKLSQIIRNKRLAMDLSQAEVARMAEVSKRTVERLELGSQATLQNAVKVMTALNVEKSILDVKPIIPVRRRATKVWVGDNDHEPENSGIQEI